MQPQTAIIIGAGPAGLTAAYEFLAKSNVKPIILEMSGDIGGISKTVNYKGNRIDIGGHRFFSKSDVVMDWWQKVFPIQNAESLARSGAGAIADWIKSDRSADPDRIDKVMLVRNRVSRIFYLRKFFDYPISLSTRTIKNLGLARMARIGTSYMRVRLFPVREEKSLETFFINRFGRELYNTFFKDYTEKVWGVPCDEIKPEWGAQRIKGLSITKAIAHALKSFFKPDKSINQKMTETSLIEQFIYPKFGPGQLWEEVARQIVARGGEIRFHRAVTGLTLEGDRITAVEVKNLETGEAEKYSGDSVFSSMPIKDLIAGLKGDVPQDVRRVADGLLYRDFITVGLLLKKLKISDSESGQPGIVPDNWIYIQERDVRIGRLQIFNNWSPYMVKNPNHVWIGLEYFCNEGDDLWSKADPEFIRFAIAELEKIGIIDSADVIDHTLIRMPKTYPAYFGTYDEFPVVRDFTDRIGNLFLVGRNGMHRYNNSDHSMLTAITAVENILNGVKSKANIWDVNTEQEYHEKK